MYFIYHFLKFLKWLKLSENSSLYEVCISPHVFGVKAIYCSIQNAERLFCQVNIMDNTCISW